MKSGLRFSIKYIAESTCVKLYPDWESILLGCPNILIKLFDFEKLIRKYI